MPNPSIFLLLMLLTVAMAAVRFSQSKWQAALAGAWHSNAWSTVAWIGATALFVGIVWALAWVFPGLAMVLSMGTLIPVL